MTKAKFHEADHTLAKKVGLGGVDARLVVNAENTIKNDKTDFVPLALPIVEQLKRDFQAARKNLPAGRDSVAKIGESVMDLKAGAGAFRYPRLAEISALLLTLLDEAMELNADGVEIVAAYINIVDIFLAKGLSNTGGPLGETMAREFSGACARYRERYVAAA